MSLINKAAVRRLLAEQNGRRITRRALVRLEHDLEAKLIRAGQQVSCGAAVREANLVLGIPPREGRR